MKKTLMMTAIATLSVALSGCDKKSESLNIEASNAATTPEVMPTMEMPTGSKMGKGSGTVAAIDAAAGKITLDHGAIPAVGWPAMKMGFSAKPAVLNGVVVGDKVDFDVTVSGSAGEVTSIKKR